MDHEYLKFPHKAQESVMAESGMSHGIWVWLYLWARGRKYCHPTKERRYKLRNKHCCLQTKKQIYPSTPPPSQQNTRSTLRFFRISTVSLLIQFCEKKKNISRALFFVLSYSCQQALYGILIPMENGQEEKYTL